MAKPRPPQLTMNGALEPDKSAVPPISPGADFASPTFRNRRTLKQLWDEADKNFFKETGYHLESAAPLHKEGVLQKWQARYDEEKSETQKKLDKLTPIVQNIVNGVEVVGAFAASAASAVFGPAQMCFNAITFVLDAPGKVKHVYDCLATLFKEVQDFLVKFKVLDRIDSKGRLDSELVENANRLLIAFTRICGIACQLLKKKRTVLVALEAVFLTNDGGVSAALTEFKDLAVTQSQVVGVISLEHVLENEDISRQILAGQMEMSLYFRTMAQKETDEKTKIVTKERLSEIAMKLFSRAELDAIAQFQAQTEALPGTMEALMSTKEYISWSNVESGGQAVLLLSGEPGTGKSYLLDTLCESLHAKRTKMLSQGPSLYIAYHSFANRRNANASKKEVAHALKCLTLQIAKQSTRYTDKLNQSHQLKDLYKEDDAKKVWQALNLFGFNPPDGSIMYLLFDGFGPEDGKDQMRELNKILLASRSVNSNFKVCIMFAGVPSIMTPQDGLSNLIEMQKVNEDVLRFYISREFEKQDCFQDTDVKTKAQKEAFAQSLLDQVQGNFEVAKKKIARIRAALDDDATSAEIEEVIKEDVKIAFNEEARDALNSLATTLSPRHLTQFKELLTLALYGWGGQHLSFYIPWLEAILKVKRKEETLEPLGKKIRKRFSKVISQSGDTAWVNYNVEEYLRLYSDTKSPSLNNDARLISLTINVQNAKKVEIQSFLLDLNARLTHDDSMFASQTVSEEDCQIHIPELDARIDLTFLCFQALNEELPEDTDKAFTYAFSHVARHVTELLRFKDQLSLAQKKEICEGLVDFLADPYYLEHGQRGGGVDWHTYWFEYCNGPATIHEWLSDEEITRKLQPMHRRWLSKALTRNDGRPDYLQEVALTLGKEWLLTGFVDNLGRFYYLSAFIAKYIRSLGPKSEALDANNELIAEAAVDTAETPASDREMNNKTTEDSAQLSPNEQIPQVESISTANFEVPDSVEGANNGGTTDQPDRPDQMAEAKKTDPDGTTATDDETKPEADSVSAEVENVLAAAVWVKDMLLDGKEDEAFSYRIATTLFDAKEYKSSREWYEKIKEDNSFYWRACIRIADIIELGENKSAESIELYKTGLDIARSRKAQNDLNKLETSVYKTTLDTMTRLLEKDFKYTEQAIEYFKEMLVLTPEAGTARWLLFRALCQQEREAEAAEMLDEWTNNPKSFGDQHPKEALCEVAADGGEHSSVSPLRLLVECVKDQVLRTRLLHLFAEAAAAASLRSDVLRQVRLLYEIAVASSTDSVETQNDQAIQDLEECLEQVSAAEELPGVDSDLSWSLINAQTYAVRFLCRLKFQALHQMILKGELQNLTGIHEGLRDQMKTQIAKLLLICRSVDIDVSSYVTAICVALKRFDWAQAPLRQEVLESVQILSDDNPDNDPWGGERLARTFCCYGDDVNMRVALSLCDRRHRASKLQPALETNGKTEKQVNESVELPNETTDRDCDVCRKSCTTATDEGYWICRYCFDVDLCSGCHDKYRKREIRYELCHPDHEFVRFYHPEAPMDELVNSKVFIDWTIQHGDNGTFTRKGGRLADLNEWVDKIRRDWNLPIQLDESRVQQ